MNKNFIKQDQYGINFQYSRNQASPLDPHSVITSYSDLTGEFLKQVNTYPGQLVALADDISNDSGITLSPKDRQHQGLYWVTNGDNAGQADFTTYKLATTYDSNISYDRIWNTVKIAYTKTFQPWASYITNFNNTVVKYATNTINNTINPALFGAYWEKSSWTSNEDSLMYKVSYINDSVFPALNDLHTFAWNTIWPYTLFLNTYTTGTLGPQIDKLTSYANTTLGSQIDKLNTYTSDTLGAAVDALHNYTFKTVIPYEETTREMLMAMLPDMPYYKPKYSDFNFSYAGNNGTFTQTYSNNATYNYFCVEYGTYYTSIPQLNIKFNWKNTAPFVKADKALYTYIEKNSKFPSNINLSHLGYTNFIGSQTMNDGDSLKASWGFTVTLMPQSSHIVNTWYITTMDDTASSSAPDAEISSIGKYTSSSSRLTQNGPYYFNISKSSSLVKQENTMMPLYDNSSSPVNSIDFSGMSTLVSLFANIYYSGPQKTFYDSLANKNIFIESTANMWNTDMYALNSSNYVSVSQFIQCYSGFKVYYGLFNLTSDVLNTGDNYKNIIKYIINSGTKPSGFNKSILKSALVTYASDSGLPRSLSTKYFGSSEMGVTEWGETTGRNCCFIGFPSKFFNYTQIDTSLRQVWEGKFSGTGSWGTFGAAGTDPQNYIIDNVSITISTGKTVNYTFIIAKTTLPFKFGGSNSSGYGLRATCQQTGLNNYNQDI